MGIHLGTTTRLCLIHAPLSALPELTTAPIRTRRTWSTLVRGRRKHQTNKQPLLRRRWSTACRNEASHTKDVEHRISMDKHMANTIPHRPGQNRLHVNRWQRRGTTWPCLRNTTGWYHSQTRCRKRLRLPRATNTKQPEVHVPAQYTTENCQPTHMVNSATSCKVQSHLAHHLDHVEISCIQCLQTPIGLLHI